MIDLSNEKVSRLLRRLYTSNAVMIFIPKAHALPAMRVKHVFI